MSVSMLDPTARRDERKHVVVRFFNHPVHDPVASEKEKRPVFKDVPYVRLQFRGDNKSETVQPALDRVFFNRDREDHEPTHLSYAEFYPEQWEAFVKGETARQAVGAYTPIEMLTELTPAKIAELKAINIHTVESLAELEHANLKKLGGQGMALRTRAEQFLAASKERVDAASMAARLEALEAENARMKTLLDGAAEESEEDAEETGSTEFDDWDGDTLRAFISDQTGQEPGKNTTLKALRKMANNIKKEKEKARGIAA